MATFQSQPPSSSSSNHQFRSSPLHSEPKQRRPFTSHSPSDSSSSDDNISFQPLYTSSRVPPARDSSSATTTSPSADLDQDVRSIRTTHNTAQARELEIDASSILLPVISHTQQDALYEYAAHSCPDDEPDPSPNEDYSSSSDEDEQEAIGETPRPRPEVRTENYPPAPSIQVQPPQSGPASILKGKPHHHHHLHGLGYKNASGNTKEKKASSGGVFSLPNLQLQFPNLQLPKNVSFPSLPAFATSSGERFGAMVEKRRRRAKTVLIPTAAERKSTEGHGHRKSFSTSSQSQREPGFIKPLQHAATDLPTISPPPQRPSNLRRSSSMGSIVSIQRRMELTRTISTTSSIGNDDLFAHIHTRPNVRAKAIKENIRAALPNVSMPQLPQFSNFNPFAAEKPESPVSNAAPDLSNSGVPPLVSSGSAKPKGESYPTIDTVTGDVVVLGGYRGSELREITPVNRKVWVPIKVGFNLRKVDFEVGLEPEDEERVTDRIVPEGMLTHIGPVDISRRLIKRLRSNQQAYSRRTHDWGYDWRLSPHINSASLIRFLETLPCNQPDSPRRGALVIAHSLGGIITRHAINQRPDLFSGIIYAGAPQHTVNILGPFRNGDSVLFNSKIFSAQVTFTLRSSFVFLPQSGECFVDKETGEKIPINFYDVNIWKELGLSPCVSDFPVNAPKEDGTTEIPRNLTLLQKLQNHASNISVGASMMSTNSNTSSNTGSSSPSPLSDAAKNVESEFTRDRTLAPQMNSSGNENSSSPSITIPKAAALKYLERTLAETLRFKQQLAPQEDHILHHRYPPTAVLYAKETPTVKGARVSGREGIKRDDVYEDLVFGAGDGVVLARASMLPDGYPKPVRKVCVQRGHLGLLGDLVGVEECLKGVVEARGW